MTYDHGGYASPTEPPRALPRVASGPAPGARCMPPANTSAVVDGVAYTQGALRELVRQRHELATEVADLRERLRRADRHLRLRTAALTRLIARKGPSLDEAPWPEVDSTPDHIRVKPQPRPSRGW